MNKNNWIQKKEQIEARIAGGQEAPEGVTELPLESIEIIDSVFQHRSGNQAGSGQHTDSLVRSLKSRKGLAFEPLVVFWLGDGWVMVDGHHRHEAYTTAERTEPVPVKVFQGTLDEALSEALRGNSRDKLSMSSREKSEAAWRLVIGTNLRPFQIVESSTRSKVTVYKMIVVRDELRQQKPEIILGNLSWVDAQRVHQGLAPREFDEAWEEKEAQALANRISKKLGNSLGKQPDILWRALEIYDPRLIEQFKESLGIDPNEPEDF